MLEYKGEHLIGSEDSDYKEAIGKIWQKINGKNYHFEMIGRKNVGDILVMVSKL